MAKPIYTYPSDELGISATITLTTGTADSNYPVTNVATPSPAFSFLSTIPAPSSASGVDILWDHGTATDAKLFSLHHHNIPAGTDVRFQRNATNAWGGPTMDVPVSISPYPNTGLPDPFAVDLTVQTGYSAGGFRYSRLHVPSLSQLVGVGSALIWSAKRQDLRALRFPIRPEEQHPTRKFRTSHGVYNKYRLGVRLRQAEGVIRNTNADFATWLSWFRATQGDYGSFLYWLDLSTTIGWIASFGDDTTDMEYSAYNVSPAHVVIEELSSGPALPTA